MKTPYSERHLLFQPYDLRGLTLRNHFLLAAKPSDAKVVSQQGQGDLAKGIPNAAVADHYACYASAGLIVTEPVQVSPQAIDQAMGESDQLGIYTKEQVQGWRRTTSVVHQAGGKIFLQLSHYRHTHSADRGTLLGSTTFTRQELLRAPQPVEVYSVAEQTTTSQSDNELWVVTHMVDKAEKPTAWLAHEAAEKTRLDAIASCTAIDMAGAMTDIEIRQIIAAFRQGAVNAISAGFDGVEIQGGDGCLIDTFLRRSSNQRMDGYGGCRLNRLRLLVEITLAVVEAVGAEKVGVQLSPFVITETINLLDNLETLILAAALLNAIDVAYLHVCEADWRDAPEITRVFRTLLRATFHGTLMITGNYTLMRSEMMLMRGYADLIGPGPNFLSRPEVLRVLLQEVRFE